VTYQTLFDTGPDGAALARNLDSLKIDLAAIDRIVLSHWHRDHSGGILEFLQRRKDVVALSTEEKNVIVDLHPSRPVARGIAPPPSYQKVLCRLPEDPTIDEIEARGATVELNEDGHVVQGSTVFVSGEIPRVIGWEKGLLGGVRWIPREGVREGSGEWVSEPVRFLGGKRGGVL
jgi:7,8-dihydropterin-6-yl-methyl-4-(beta-D-ribofuranosyl)aminobenzene 5'-phosphate synthase